MTKQSSPPLSPPPAKATLATTMTKQPSPPPSPPSPKATMMSMNTPGGTAAAATASMSTTVTITTAIRRIALAAETGRTAVMCSSLMSV